MFAINAIRRFLLAGFVAAALVMGGTRQASAHCDTMSGPVVTAARNALESGNVNLVLIWVQPGDEAGIRDEFARARADRAAGGAAQEAADRRFFEALVRIHRAGEGAPFTGIKPAGTDVGPVVAAADESLANGSVDAVRAVLTNAVQSGIERHFHAVMDRRDYRPDDVAAGRAYVKAYVEYTHFAEGLYDRATAATVHHEHATEAHAAGHEDDGTAEGAGAHTGHAGHADHLPWLLVGFLGLTVLGESGWIALTRKGNNPRHSPGNERSKP